VICLLSASLLAAAWSLGPAVDRAKAYTPHTPISINGDADFTAVNGVTQGSGTPSDPFVIEGWEIAPSSSNGIEIYNTRSHFAIRDVFVHSAPFGYTGVWLGNVSNGRVENSTASGNWGGLVATLSSNITFIRNNVTGNMDGLGTSQSKDIRFLYNNASYNTAGAGIGTAGSFNTTIEGNTFIGNNWGVLTQWQTDAVIRGNDIRQNTEGAKLYLSSGISVYHNAFLGNSIQAKDDGGPQNAWDNGYPKGGNFWDDFTGPDSFRGPLQDQLGSDGIGDTPYVIDADSRDRYPLMSPSRIDWMPPEMFNATIDGDSHHISLLSGLGPAIFSAIADDTPTGGSNISSANLTLGQDNWTSALPMSASDGIFDAANETIQATIVPSPAAGDIEYCAYAVDSAWNDNTTGVCATLTIIDDIPPRVRNVTVDGQSSLTIIVGTPSVFLEAVVDDSATGKSVIGGANHTSPRGNWSSSTPMTPADVLDSDTESFYAVVDTSSFSLGNRELCAYGWDVVTNRNITDDCATLSVVPPPPVRPDYMLAAAQPASPFKAPFSSQISLSIQVLNHGNATATNDSTLAFYNETPPAPPFRIFTVAPMAPGGFSPRFTVTWISPAAPGTYLVSANVDYYDDVTEWDETDNVQTWTVEVVAGPITSLVIGSPNYTSTTMYISSSTPLDFSVISQSGIGIINTTYRIDGGDWVNYTEMGQFTLAGEGNHTIDWFSVDLVGNVEDVNSATLTVDDAPPATALSIGQPKYLIGGIFITSSTGISLQATDGGTLPVGTAATEYRVDGGMWRTYSAPFLLTGEGSHSVEYLSVDLLGNAEAQHGVSIVVDDTPPITAVLIGNPKYLVGGTFVTSQTHLSLQAVDGGMTHAGLNTTEYRIDSGNWIAYSSPFRLQEEGAHVTDYRSIDLLGNSEAVHSTQIIVDDTSPATAIKIGEPNYQTAELYVTSSTSINLTSADGSVIPVGLGGIEFQIDGGGWVSYVSNITLSGADGQRTMEVRATDLLGNNEAVKSLLVVLDNTPPAITIDPFLDTYTTETDFALIVSDSGSGVNYTEYKVDGGNWTNYSGGFTLPVGQHNILFRSTDHLGNENEDSRVVQIRSVEPPPSNQINYLWVVAAIMIVAALLLILLMLKRRKSSQTQKDQAEIEETAPVLKEND
jgi:parallel beta-helix repeat protein